VLGADGIRRFGEGVKGVLGVGNKPTISENKSDSGHTKGARPSTKPKHESGDARRGRDRGGRKRRCLSRNSGDTILISLGLALASAHDLRHL
jgi:hypothetical protein